LSTTGREPEGEPAATRLTASDTCMRWVDVTLAMMQ
jgi:hypothetical protein